MLNWLKKKECIYDPDKFDRFTYNDISILIEKDPPYSGYRIVRGCDPITEKATEE